MSGSGSDRLALVTGSSSGIGAALVRCLLERGWTVFGVARRPAAIGDARYRHLRVDLGDLATLAARAESEIGPVMGDPRWRRIALVNNAAGTGVLGPLARVPMASLEQAFAVNAIAPIWLMGFVARTAPAGAVLRIVNVSTGAAVRGFPGLASYGAPKAALRLAGMSLAGEWEDPGARGPGEERASGPRNDRPRDAALLSYEPGVVETAMQVHARSQDPAEFPWVGMFHEFLRRGINVPPEMPAAELVAFLESEHQPFFAERRRGG